MNLYAFIQERSCDIFVMLLWSCHSLLLSTREPIKYGTDFLILNFTILEELLPTNQVVSRPSRMKLHYTQIQLVMQLVIMSYADKCPFQEPIKCTNDKFKASEHAQEYDIRMGSNYATKYFCVPHEGYTLPRELDLSPHGIGKTARLFSTTFNMISLLWKRLLQRRS